MRADLSGIRIGFVGLGVMGAPMAGHLLAAGADVTVHTRTAERARPLLDAGARWAASPAAAAREADFVLTIVGFPDDVRDVYFGVAGGNRVAGGDGGMGGDGGTGGDSVVGDDGVLATAKVGALLIDLTTSRPALAREVHAAAAARGAASLDAPVSGGDVGAKNATLSIMVGGDAADFDRAGPVLSVLGHLVVLQGPPGAGQLTKLCNQIAIAGTMFGALEALLFARRMGLDPSVVLTSIGAGAAASWTLANLFPRAERGDFAPGFAARHFLKDLRLALDEARAAALDLPGLALAERLYGRMVEEEGRGDLGTHGLLLTIMGS